MNTVIGLIIIVVSIALGVYVGGWVMFIGGIVDIIEAIKATPVDAMAIAVGLLKTLLASTAGVAIAACGVIFGASFIR